MSASTAPLSGAGAGGGGGAGAAGAGSKRPFSAVSPGASAAASAAAAAVAAGLPAEVELGGHAKLVLRPLGGGAEVGRSCLLLDYVGVHERLRLLLDCGVLPAFTGRAALPYLDEIDGGPASVDVVVITHFHLDHCAALPHFTERMAGFRGRIFATHPTIAVMKLILADYTRVSGLEAGGAGGAGGGGGGGAGGGDALFDEADIARCVARMETVDFRQRVSVGGVTLTFFPAGHVLGAAMVQVEVADLRVLYTGDYSCVADRHLAGAEAPPGAPPDLLIVEATHGMQRLPSREARERAFIDAVERIVARGGRCLIPVFALGIAQELLLILDEHWAASAHLRGVVPIFHANAMAHKGLEVYRTFVGYMNAPLQAAAAARNPWRFRHVAHIRGKADFAEPAGACVVLASPGMLQKGFSRFLFDRWCEDARNGVVLCGYSSEGTLARQLETTPTEVESEAHRRMTRRLSIDRVSFSAHADAAQTATFIEALRPTAIVLVHGEHNEMRRLHHALFRRYADVPGFNVHMPGNNDPIELDYEVEHAVHIAGALARRRLTAGAAVAGILVKRADLSHLLVAPADLPAYSDLAPAQLRQVLHVPFRATYGMLKAFVTAMFPDAAEDALLADERERAGGRAAAAADAESAAPGARALAVWGGRARLVHYPPDRVVVSWLADPLCDMLVDTLVAVVTQAEVSQVAIKAIGRHTGHDHAAHVAHDHEHDEAPAPAAAATLAAAAPAHGVTPELASAAAPAAAPATAPAPAPIVAASWQRWLLSRGGADLSELPAHEAAAVALGAADASLAQLAAADGGTGTGAAGSFSARGAAAALRACAALSAAEAALLAGLLAMLLARYTAAGLHLEVAKTSSAEPAPSLVISITLDQRLDAAEAALPAGASGGDGDGGGSAVPAGTLAAVVDAPPLVGRIEYFARGAGHGGALPCAALQQLHGGLAAEASAAAAAPPPPSPCAMLAGFVIRGAAVGAAAALDMRVACSCGGGGGGGGGSTGGTSSRAAQLPVPPALPTLTQRLHDASDVQTALMADLERAARGALAAML